MSSIYNVLETENISLFQIKESKAKRHQAPCLKECPGFDGASVSLPTYLLSKCIVLYPILSHIKHLKLKFMRLVETELFCFLNQWPFVLFCYLKFRLDFSLVEFFSHSLRPSSTGPTVPCLNPTYLCLFLVPFLIQRRSEILLSLFVSWHFIGDQEL